jgi:hypothetical protein
MSAPTARVAVNPSARAPRASITITVAPLAAMRRATPASRRAATGRQPPRAAADASSSRWRNYRMNTGFVSASVTSAPSLRNR